MHYFRGRLNLFTIHFHIYESISIFNINACRAVYLHHRHSYSLQTHGLAVIRFIVSSRQGLADAGINQCYKPSTIPPLNRERTIFMSPAACVYRAFVEWGEAFMMQIDSIHLSTHRQTRPDLLQYCVRLHISLRLGVGLYV